MKIEGGMIMNQKGFSLIELIAMVVVLGILMVITVPNIAGIVKNNRENIVKEDVHKMVSNAKTRVNTKQAKNPKGTGNCVVMTLGYVDSNHDLKEGINGGKYNQNESFLVIRKENESGNSFTYRYYIRLVEEIDRTSSLQKYEVPLTEHNELEKNIRDYLTNLAPTVSGNMAEVSTTEATTIINNMGVGCGAVEQKYTA